MHATGIRMNTAVLPDAVERLDLDNTRNTTQVFLHKQRFDFALERIRSTDRVLEIGTGTGYFSRILSRHCDYTGLEIDPESCQTTRGKISGGEVVEGDAQSQPFPNERFTRIVALEVLEHVPDYRQAVKEIHRCLTREGVVVISVPFRKAGGTSDNPYHIYEPGAAELITEFDRHFTKVEVFYQYFPESPFMTAARALHVRRFVGLAQLYADFWNGVAGVYDRVKIDQSGKGMKITLVLVITGKKSN